MNKTKTIKALLITQAVLMYISLAYFILGLIFTRSEQDSMNLNWIIFVMFGICAVASVVVSIVLLVVSAKNIRRNEYDNVSFTVMVVKIVLIPWYIANFVFYLAFTLGMLNPFAMVLIPLFIIYAIIVTYLTIISTSLANLGFLFARVRAKTVHFNKTLIIATVFHFIECIDFIGAIILYKELNRLENTEIKEIEETQQE